MRVEWSGRGVGIGVGGGGGGGASGVGVSCGDLLLPRGCLRPRPRVRPCPRPRPRPRRIDPSAVGGSLWFSTAAPSVTNWRGHG